MQEEKTDLNAACRVLGIEKSINIIELRRLFRQHSLRYHTDHCREEPLECRRKFDELRSAYLVLLNFCESYTIDLKKAFAHQENEEYSHLNRFYDGWLGDL